MMNENGLAPYHSSLIIPRSSLTNMDWHKGEYTISTERSRLDLGVIHRFISEESYWGKGRALEVVRRSVENSLPFGIYKGEELVGFARVVTDYATFAWLADVFVLEAHRERGLS